MTSDMLRSCSITANALWSCGMAVVIAVIWHDSGCNAVMQCNGGHITVVVWHSGSCVAVMSRCSGHSSRIAVM
jgi:hypothetical protein